MRYDDVTVGYRSEDLGAALRLEGLLEQRGEEATRASSELGGLYARRVARAAAGAAMTFGWATMVIEALVNYAANHRFDHSVPILCGSWVAGGLAYALSLPLAQLRFARVLLPTGDELKRGPRADVERLEATAPGREARRRVDRLEQRSVAWPMIGIALLAPLTLHWLATLVFALAVARARVDFAAASFGWWIGISLLLVGHTHLVLAVLAHRFARRLRGLSAEQIARRPHGGWAAYGWTVISTAPVALLYFVPPLLVGLTGVVFVPALFAVMRQRVLRERAALTA